MTHSPLLRPLLALVAGVALLVGAGADSASAQSSRREAELDRILEQHRELRAELGEELEEIATFCDERGLPEAAATVRDTLVEEPDDGRIAIVPLPREMQPPIPATLPDDEKSWRSRLRRAKSDYAGRLYLHARRTLSAGFPSRAYGFVHEVAEFDPDHREARRLLGHIPYDGNWVTPFDAKMLRNHVWHDRFGWLLKTHVERYENGERYLTDQNGRNGRWVPAAQEANVRRDFRHAWQIRTAHYLVKTNHSLEEGVRIARALELYHDFFKQVFAAYFVSPEQQKTLFSGGTSRRRPTADDDPHVVHFYRSKEDYVAALVGNFPQIAITNGLYQSGDRIAYFFHDDSGENLPTIFHEATHQLFYESDSLNRDVALNAHFWIIEGIACYMESFERTDGRLVCGNPEYVRFDNARYRLLTSKDYQPFADFSSLGMRQFQFGGADELGIRYSQASGLAHFLMHYERGRYRDALIVHLSELYSPRPLRRVRTLPELLDLRATDLDEQYREFLTAQSRDLARHDP